MKKQVKSTKSSAGNGPYSQGIVSGGFVFVSGQGPLHPETGEIIGKDISEQTQLTMENVQYILEAAGCTMNDVVKAGVFLANIDDFDAFNEVYQSFFEPPFPARTCVESGLAGILVEIDVIAKIPE